jgi:hypothetical protein
LEEKGEMMEPTDHDCKDRRIEKLKAELAALKKRIDDAPKTRVSKLWGRGVWDHFNASEWIALVKVEEP